MNSIKAVEKITLFKFELWEQLHYLILTMIEQKLIQIMEFTSMDIVLFPNKLSLDDNLFETMDDKHKFD